MIARTDTIRRITNGAISNIRRSHLSRTHKLQRIQYYGFPVWSIVCLICTIWWVRATNQFWAFFFLKKRYSNSSPVVNPNLFRILHSRRVRQTWKCCFEWPRRVEICFGQRQPRWERSVGMWNFMVPIELILILECNSIHGRIQRAPLDSIFIHESDDYYCGFLIRVRRFFLIVLSNWFGLMISRFIAYLCARPHFTADSHSN